MRQVVEPMAPEFSTSNTSAKYIGAECATVGQQADSAWSEAPVRAHPCVTKLALSSATLDSGTPTVC